MDTAINVFVNGISGVFIGLAVLYAAIKANQVVADFLAAREVGEMRGETPGETPGKTPGTDQ